MLCCGLLTAVAAAILLLRRWLRRVPRVALVAGGVVLIASPALAYALDRPPQLERADVIERAMQSLCGGRD